MYNKLLNKPKLLSDFISISSKTNYFDAIISNNNNRLENIQFKSFAKIIQQNIQKQALLKNTHESNELKIFGEKDFDEKNISIAEKYSSIRMRYRWTKTTPFGINDLSEIKNRFIWNSITGNDENVSIELPTNSTKLSVYYFVTEKQSLEYFHRIQRQRKIWWMRYAANPGRIQITEVKKYENDGFGQGVSLLAYYPFGNLAIEHVDMIATTDQFPEIKIPLPPRIIRTWKFLEIATIETVLDGIDDGDYGEICIHRKLAPYQCAIYCLSTDDSLNDDLKDLTKYLSMMLQKHNISILSIDECIFNNQSQLNKQFFEMDAIGVPYELILDADTLENGLLKLRNRDTTICEQIHISYLPHYLLKIFRA